MITRRRFLKYAVVASTIPVVGCGSEDTPGSCGEERHFDDLEGRCVDSRYSSSEQGDDFPILFERGGNIMAMTTDGSDEKEVVLGDDRSRGPVWSPDGRQIAYLSSGGVYVMPSNGGQAVRIVDREASDLGDAIDTLAWCSAGLMMYTFRTIQITPTFWGKLSEVYAVNPDGTGLRRVVSLSSEDDGTISYFSNSCSSDGKMVYLGSDNNSGNSLFMVNASGSIVRVPNTDNTLMTPAISPDGQRIAFYGIRPELSLYTISLDGSGLEAVTPRPFFAPANSDSGLAFSPDGRYLLVPGDSERVDLTRPQNFYLVEIATGETHQLTDNTTSMGFLKPSWRR